MLVFNTLKVRDHSAMGHTLLGKPTKNQPRINHKSARNLQIFRLAYFVCYVGGCFARAHSQQDKSVGSICKGPWSAKRICQKTHQQKYRKPAYENNKAPPSAVRQGGRTSHPPLGVFFVVNFCWFLLTFWAGGRRATKDKQNKGLRALYTTGDKRIIRRASGTRV